LARLVPVPVATAVPTTGPARAPRGDLAVGAADPQASTGDLGPAQLAEQVVRQPGGQLDERVLVADVDVADVLAGQTALVGQRADQRPRCDAVAAAHLDPVRLRVRGTRLEVGARGLVDRLRLQQQRAVALGHARQGRGDLLGRDSVLALVVA